MHRPVRLTLVAALLLWSGGAAAQEESLDGLPERLAVVVSEECGTGETTSTLREALTARLPETEIVVDSEDDSEVRLYWRAGETTGCGLELRGAPGEGDEISRVDLAPSAEEPVVRNAASRIAWLLQTRAEESREPAREESEREESEPEGQDETEQQDETEEQNETANEEPEEVESEEASETEPEGEETGGDEAESEDASGTEPDGEEAGDDAEEQESGEASEGETEASESESEEKEGEEPSEPSFAGGTPVPFRATLIPLVSAPAGGPADPVPAYALNVVGRNYALRGLEFGLLFNTERSHAQGMQIAGLGNWVAGPVRGFQTATLLNVDAGELQGLASATLLNISGGLRGVQVAVAPGNLSVGETRGVQVSSAFNVSTDDVAGMQLGAANVAADVDGFQGGLINVGGDVEGLQLGAVNIAADSSASIGALNINWDRPAYGHVWTNELLVLSAGLQHGSRHFQNIFRFGYRPFMEIPLVVPGLGVGGHFPFELFGDFPVYLGVDAMYNLAIPVQTETVPAHWGQLRMTTGFRLGRRVAVYSGFTLNVLQSVRSTPAGGQSEVDVPFAYRFSDGGPALWPGLLGGLRF